MRIFSFTITLFASFLVSAAVWAADIEVKMLNKGEEGKMIFEPSFIKAQKGDNIIFLPTDKGHMAASIKGLIPVGAWSVSAVFLVLHKHGDLFNNFHAMFFTVWIMSTAYFVWISLRRSFKQNT